MYGFMPFRMIEKLRRSSMVMGSQLGTRKEEDIRREEIVWRY